jgi:TonB family protein
MTSRRGLWLEFACAAVLTALSCHANADDPSALIGRLHSAAALNSIDDVTIKPWHLKLSFQLFDAKGAPTEKGTVEEWWAGPLTHKTVYTSPSYTSTEVRTKDGLFRSKGMTYVPSSIELLLRQVVHPMPSESDIADSKPDLRKETPGKTTLDCIMLAQEIKNVPYPPIGLFPTYCFDRDTESLRVSYDFGSQLIVRNKLGTFQQRTVVIDQMTLQHSVTLVSAHMDTLQSMEPNQSDFVPSVDLEQVKLDGVMVSAGVMAGLKTSGGDPIYPEASKRNHVSGTVILKARIGSDGHIHSLKVVSTPDADLAIASLIAVRQWTYKPYLLNGEPVDVDTQITVHYAFGPA